MSNENGTAGHGVPDTAGPGPSRIQQAASLYLSIFHMVPIPVPARTKEPKLPGWQNLRPTLQALPALFSDPDSNLGILLGEPSWNLADVDLDCLETRAAAHGLLPFCGWVSGRHSAPSTHHWYRLDRPPDGATTKYFDPVAGPGDDQRRMLVELRAGLGDQLMTLAPPSVHPSGERLRWEQRIDRPDLVSANILQRAVAKVAGAALLGRYWPKGARQDSALALAGALLRLGWTRPEVAGFLRSVCAAAKDEESKKRCEVVGPTAEKLSGGENVTGWPALERCLGEHGPVLVKTVRGWLEGTSADPRRKPRLPEPYHPFPTDAVPEPLRSYVVQGAAALGCDSAYLALPALAAVASLMGNTRAIRLKRDWSEPSVTWAGIVGDSGTLKSPALQLVIGPVFRIQKRLLNEYRVQAAAYQKELQDHKEAVRKFKKDGGDDPGPPPESPRLRRLVCSDTTIEKLAAILEDNPRGILAARDELAGWLGSFSRYKAKGAGSDLPLWLEAHRAGPWIVDRKTGDRPTLFIPHAAVCVVGSIQPVVLAEYLTPAYVEAGLFARVLLAMPPKARKRWTEDEVDPDVVAAYERLIDGLLALEPDRDRDGEPTPFPVRLDPEAKKAWVAFYDEWAAEQAAAEGQQSAMLAKLEAYCARFALVHHTVAKLSSGQDCCDPVERDSVAAGAALTRWFAAEARRVFAALAESPAERDLRKLVEFMRSRGGSLTVKDLQRSNGARYRTADDAAKALEALVQAGLARWQERPGFGKGGRPTRDCVLNPDNPPDETDETPGDGGGDGPTGPPVGPDETSVAADGIRENSGLGGVSSVSSGAGSGIDEREANDNRPGKGTGGFGGPEGVSSDNPGDDSPLEDDADSACEARYRVVSDAAGLETVGRALNETDVVSLDTETVGLDPGSGRVRLLSLGLDTSDGGQFAYLIDCDAVDPDPLWDDLADKNLLLHNAGFDLGFLGRMRFEPAGVVHDTLLLAQLLTAGSDERNTLAACCQRHLGRDLDKALQESDWSGPLSRRQLAYAATDVLILGPLHKALQTAIAAAKLTQVAEIERRCRPAVAWLALSGVPFDRHTWVSLARSAADDEGRLRRELDAAAPPKPGALFDSWNWSSPLQVKEALTLAGCPAEATDDQSLAKIDHPLARLLRQHREASKRSVTYGKEWLKHVSDDERIFPTWRQIGAASGRMSCSSPNMQQLPRGEYRRCVAASPGRVLVKADFSQVELRIACRVSGDAAMLAAYRRGEDLHTATARAVLGLTEVSKEERQLAKALNFGLLYGMGAARFREYARTNYGVELPLERARTYRGAFFKSYPGLARWHRRVGATNAPVDTRTLTGRRRVGVTRFTEKLNTPVQGTGADGLKLALALLWERRAECPGAIPVLVVHDEIVVECDEAQAEAAAAWLKRAMLDGMAPLIDPVPVEVEVKLGRTWGGG